ncbi:MAG TPA: FHA domain-containing protein [Planctomicrobium sp.]|nr:FHA domain-containing protein [Planctomicrobium sp.]
MEDQNSLMLAYATAAPGPLRLAIRPGDGTWTEHEIQSPYAIIGRGTGSDIQLTDKTVSFRHAYLQVIGPRVAYVDLLSTAGIQVAGPPFSGWLSPKHEVSIGGTKLRLLGEGWESSPNLPAPQNFRPRDESREEYGVLPQVDLELLNSGHQGMKWPINRVITLVGRDDRCRITVADERLSRVQCALLLLPSGLWVVDLMGKGGVQLDGHACNCGLLAPGAVLEIGSYRLTAHYQSITQSNGARGAIASSAEREFLTRSNRIFLTDIYHNTVIVYPHTESHAFFKDIHVEASRVCDLFLQKKFHNLVIDFSHAEQMPHTIPEGLAGICRVVPGRVAICGLNPDSAATIQHSNALKVLPQMETLPEAIQSIYT